MGFLRRVGKFAKKAVKAYATYQTGGLAGVAFAAAASAARRKGRAVAMAPMVPPMTSGMSSTMAMMMREEAMPTAPVSMPDLPGLTQLSLPTRNTPVSMLPQLTRSLPGVIRRLPRIAGAVGRALPGVGTAIGAVQLGRDLLGGSRSTRVAMGMRPRYRRINPANGKAAMRAVRRIKATRKLLAKIERSLPKRRSSGPAYCPPARRAPPRRRH